VKATTGGQTKASREVYLIQEPSDKTNLTNSIAPASQRSPYKVSIESHRRQEDGGAFSNEPTIDKVATGLPALIDRN